MKQSGSFTALAAMYKQLDASFGDFSMDILKASTKALASEDASDATYTSIEAQIDGLTTQRNDLASQIITALNGAEFSGQVIDSGQAQQLMAQAQSLLDQAHALANAP